LQTGAVRKKDRAGRHTTVARKLVELPRAAGEPQMALIDVPGLRALGLAGARAGLEATFPEIVALAAACHYRDCTHTDEPGCVVTQAVEDGTLEQRRLESYRAIALEVEE
jgi:ribosome biogenesis GTPase